MRRVERVVVLAIVAFLCSSTWVVIDAASTQEPYVNSVCRDQFGHRMECIE